MRGLEFLAALTALMSLSAAAPPPEYAAGQVWEYHARTGEEGSLLKIQRIEDDPELTKAGPIYHISVIGLRLRNPSIIRNFHTLQ